MKDALFIGIDIGTQGTKTVLCGENSVTLAEAFSPSVLEHPEKNAVCENPDRIFNSVITTIKEVIEKSGVDGNRVAAVAMDAQMAGIMGIDSNFEAVTYLDSWLDSRCAPYTEKIRQEGGNDCIALSGGQIMNTHAAKILWWKNERPEQYKNICKFVMPNGYVAGKLCGLCAEQAFIDQTFLHFNNFSDNRNLCFNDSLLKTFDILPEKMPQIVSSHTVVGIIKREYAQKCGISENVKVIAGCGDTAASSLGAGITKPGLAYDVAGTASVFACCTDHFAPDTINHTLLFSRSVIDGLFLPLAYVTGGGLTLKWFSDISGRNLRELDSLAENSPIGSRGVTFIPHFSGRSCPLNNNASGAFLGLHETSDAGTLYRAILESIAFEYKGFLNIMRDCGCINNISVIRGVGGGAKSNIFAKIKVDTLGAVYMPCEHICSAPEAMARLAAFATGHSNGTLSQQFSDFGGGQTIDFVIKNHETYQTSYLKYKKDLENYLNIKE